MISGKIPANENERLSWLKDLDILDTLEEKAYDDLTHIASQICDVPIALVSLIDETRQWFKSHHGLDATETPRELAFCGHAINQDEVFIIEDADNDERFHDNPLVTDAPYVKFYAGAPLIMDNNIRIGTLCVIDNHARKITNDQKESLTALARQVVSQLQLRLKIKEMQDLDKAKDEFLSMVSHELRTPLTSLKGSLGILNHQSDSLSEAIKPMMDIAVRNADQLLVIVNDILDLAKMEAGKLEMHFSKVNIVELAQQALQLNASYIERCTCHASLEVSSDVKSIYANADQQRLLQVISNFISNSAKFSSDKGQIIISIDVEGDYVKLNVTDYGEGIPEEHQHKLFMKFQQLSGVENQKLPGTGLGLNISKHIIDAHHGEIGFDSVPNKKTTFFFKLKIVH
jgi:signal transduction histidine kinase